MSITFFCLKKLNSVSQEIQFLTGGRFFWLLQCLTVKLIRTLDKFNRLERTDCVGGQSRRKLAIVYFFP